jgi:Holliday junction resolvasome RuvABC endonuclease subunit
MAKINKLGKPEHIKSILAVDPGTTAMGWAYTHTDLLTGNFTVYDYGIIKPANLANKEKDLRGLFEDRILRVDIVEREYLKLIDKFKADFHVSEGAFFHSKSPDAYAALSVCIHTLASTLFKCYKRDIATIQVLTEEHIQKLQQRYTLRKFAPKHIKRMVSEDGTSNKDKIQFSILDNPRIQFAHVPEKPLIEHEADAIGAAYTFALVLPIQIPTILA